MKLVFGKTPWTFFNQIFDKNLPLIPYNTSSETFKPSSPLSNVNMAMEKSNTHTTLAGLYLASCIMITLWSCSKFPQLGMNIPQKNPWAPIWLMPMLEVFFTKFLLLLKTVEEPSYHMSLETKHGAQSSNLELGRNISLILMQIKLINEDTK
jgi:hypothetical protein